ncbi:MAG TPA: nucleotidyltransferase domain-containing protein [Stellaceae bacterium]|jgi:predicted nucleotidyltransferase
MSILSYDTEALARLCRSHRIRRLALFGSVLKGSDRPDSDVDFLVEFERDAVPGLLAMAEIEAELSALLGRPVDLRTANELSPHFRQAVERAAEVQFAA